MGQIRAITQESDVFMAGGNRFSTFQNLPITQKSTNKPPFSPLLMVQMVFYSARHRAPMVQIV
jgi:hypothetical protein